MQDQDFDKKPGQEDREKPEEIIDEITSTLDGIQKDFSTGATIAGEEKERFELMRPAWVDLSNRATTDPAKAEIYVSGIDVLAAFRDELKEYRPRIAGLVGDLSTWLVPSSNSTTSSTDVTVTIVSSGDRAVPAEVTLPKSDRFEESRSRLSQLDQDLADTYAAVREVLYGTTSDPERGALYLTRQIFDHFFGLLAPDDDVRQSEIWISRNRENTSDRVTRSDRVNFAARKYVENQAKRKTLLASAKHMLDVYQLLNKAHKRGNLNPNEARQALREMFTMIENWIWSIKINGS